MFLKKLKKIKINKWICEYNLKWNKDYKEIEFLFMSYKFYDLGNIRLYFIYVFRKMMENIDFV